MQFIQLSDEVISQELIQKIKSAAGQKAALEREIDNLRSQVEEILEDLQYTIEQECQFAACEYFDIHRDEYSLLKQIFNNQEREYEVALQEEQGQVSVQFFATSNDEMTRLQVHNLENKGYLVTYTDFEDRLFVRLQVRFFSHFKNTLDSIESRIRNLDIYKGLFRSSLHEN